MEFCESEFGMKALQLLAKTSVQRKTLDPVWDLDDKPLTFATTSRLLRLRIWDRDVLTRDDFMGGAVLSVPFCYALQHAYGKEKVTINFYDLGKTYWAKKPKSARVRGSLSVTLSVESGDTTTSSSSKKSKKSKKSAKSDNPLAAGLKPNPIFSGMDSV